MVYFQSTITSSFCSLNIIICGLAGFKHQQHLQHLPVVLLFLYLSTGHSTTTSLSIELLRLIIQDILVLLLQVYIKIYIHSRKNIINKHSNGYYKVLTIRVKGYSQDDQSINTVYQ